MENIVTISQLFNKILSRKEADPAVSYTARLLSEGPPKISAKVLEEAGETIVAALSADRKAVITESADLLYHLCVLWAALEISPEDVMRVLDERGGMSGLSEKAMRE